MRYGVSNRVIADFAELARQCRSGTPPALSRFVVAFLFTLGLGLMFPGVTKSAALAESDRAGICLSYLQLRGPRLCPTELRAGPL